MAKHEKKLKLTDLIQLSGIKLKDYKIHCATGTKTSPLEAFLDGEFKEWQERQNKKNFECSQILSLIHLGGARWLFAGVYDVLGVQPGTWKKTECYLYSTKEVRGLEHLTGRVVVEFEKDFRASYLRGEKHADRLRAAEIRGQRMTIGDFPGFNGVLLSYKMLKTVVREMNSSWRTALSNVAGVYLITDISSGKLYVGSAYGGEGIWQRWCSYAKSGHGGNVELRQLLAEKDVNYADNFQFSLLEICDINSSDESIIARECHWKNVLKSREFGLNIT
jgi:hypothetical protein